jgi:hypothetical protein
MRKREWFEWYVISRRLGHDTFQNIKRERRKGIPNYEMWRQVSD